MVGQFNPTALVRYFRPAFRRTFYVSGEALQKDLDKGLRYDNHKRAHPGCRNTGARPKAIWETSGGEGVVMRLASGGRTVCIALAVLAALVLPAVTHAATEDALCRQYLAIVEDAVDQFEPLWKDDSQRVPNSGYYDFGRYDTWGPKWYAPEITVPGTGMVVFCYSVLLGETDQATFGKRQVPRAVLLDHAIKAIRWCCLTSAYVDTPYEFPIPGGYTRRIKDGSWIRPHGHRTDVMGWLTVGTMRLWDRLDAETRRLVEQVMIGAAPRERLVRRWTFGQGGNHDIVKQDMASTIGAAFMFPRRADAAAYLDVIRGNAIDLVSTEHDRACRVVADGRPVHEWSQGWNLYPDYSSDHHGWAQVWYGGDLLFEARCYVEFMSRLAGMKVPEVFTYDGNGFDGVLAWHKVLCLPEGEPASVHGMEYDAYYGAGLLAYCYGAVVKKDPVSAALEERAAGLLRRHTRAVGVYDYHRNSWAKAAAAYLMHRLAGRRAEPPPIEQAWDALQGAFHYRWQKNLIHRDTDRWAAFSWGSTSNTGKVAPCGFVVPARGLRENLEPLVYFHPQSLTGEVSVTAAGKPQAKALSEPIYRYRCRDDGIQTAGVVSGPLLDRYYAFWSLPDGPCVLFTVLRTRAECEVTWTGLPVQFYARPGMTSGRRYVDAQGEQPLEQPAERTSSWWCVDDALGMVVAGGTGRARIQRSVGNNWARTDAYKDKCDGVFVSGLRAAKAAPETAPVDLAATLWTDTPHDRIARMAGTARRITPLPPGWKGQVIDDPHRSGTRHLAVVNLFGLDTSATVDVSMPEGAAVVSAGTTVTGRTGRTCLHLEALETFGESVEVYAEVLDGGEAIARRVTPTRYVFQPAGGKPVRLALRYTGGAAKGAVWISGDGGEPQRFPPDAAGGVPRFVVDLEGPGRLEIQCPAADHVGPAVEIADIHVRHEDAVSVEVTAADRSGIAGVELFCDGQSLGTRASPPYAWTHRPGKGSHTYHAVATDGAARPNRRSSFKRTVDVGVTSR